MNAPIENPVQEMPPPSFTQDQMVRMKKPDHIPPEMDVRPDQVWAFKVAGWSES